MRQHLLCFFPSHLVCPLEFIRVLFRSSDADGHRRPDNKCSAFYLAFLDLFNLPVIDLVALHHAFRDRRVFAERELHK